MADDQPWWEKLGGMVGSALKSPTTYQNLLGLAVGGLGGREAALDYMAPIEAQRQHKALQQLAINMGVIQPGQNLPPGLDDPKEFRKFIEPKRKYDKTGYWEERYGQEPKRVTTGDVAEKLPTNEEWTTAQDLYFKNTGKVPQSRADVFPYIEQAQQINRQNKLDQAAAMTGQKPIHVPGVGFVTPGVPGTGPKVVPIPGEQPKKTKSDLDTSITADRMKGIGWHLPDGSSVDPTQYKTRADALAVGAIPFAKDDETKFKQYDTVAQTAKEMLTLLPAVADKIGSKDWPTLVGRAMSQSLRGAQIKTLARRDPALAQYLERLQTLSLNMTKQVLPAGRIPVWDQQLLMGVFVSPQMNAPTQQAQLEDILRRSEASKQNAMLYAKGSLGSTTAPEPPLTPESAAAQVDEGDTFQLKGRTYQKVNGKPVPLTEPLPAH